jgi:hypothetical protein
MVINLMVVSKPEAPLLCQLQLIGLNFNADEEPNNQEIGQR